jgi:hypothetical protein
LQDARQGVVDLVAMPAASPPRESIFSDCIIISTARLRSVTSENSVANCPRAGL